MSFFNFLYFDFSYIYYTSINIIYGGTAQIYWFSSVLYLNRYNWFLKRNIVKWMAIFLSKIAIFYFSLYVWFNSKKCPIKFYSVLKWIAKNIENIYMVTCWFGVHTQTSHSTRFGTRPYCNWYPYCSIGWHICWKFFSKKLIVTIIIGFSCWILLPLCSECWYFCSDVLKFL